jgi:membrane protease YdiL (CAAX protease family)
MATKNPASLLLTNYVTLFFLTTALLVILIKKYDIALNKRIHTPKLKETILVIGIAIIAAIIFKPLTFPKEYFSSIFGSEVNVQLPDNQMPTTELLLFLFFCCLISPIQEEIFYRRILMKGLLVRYSPNGVIVILSVIFGLFHFNISFASLFLGSIVISYIYLISDSIGLAIIFHGVFNAVTIASSFLHTRTGNFFFSGWYLLTLMIGVILMFLLFKGLQSQLNKRPSLLAGN